MKRAQALKVLYELPRRTLAAPVHGYRYLLKPWLGNACRFEPSCSAYALEALKTHGAIAGAGLASARLMRCHPWCAGGVDPVPSRLPRLIPQGWSWRPAKPFTGLMMQRRSSPPSDKQDSP